ncbi:MAG TPA: HAD family phosphatase [Candidatus Saccharimonadales bacterium]|nr:HAD family phosphatase [Candidatus Saccharimonadales bacterium]
MIKAVLFDFGGVLSEAGKRGSIRRWLGKVYGLDIDVRQIDKVFYKMWRGQITDAAFLAEVHRRYPDAPVASKEDFLKAMEQFKRSSPVYALAEALRKHGIKTGILSNVFGIGVGALRAGGFYNGFDPLLLSCEVGYAKPDPEFYEIAIAKLGVSPKEIVFIDDQQYVLDPARAMGMHTILACSPKQIVRDTKALIAIQNNLIL